MKKIIIRVLLISLITISIMFQMSVQASSKVQLGDINEDGVVDSKDLLLMVKHIAGTNNEEHSNWMLEGKEYEIADITKNGLVNGSDLLIMLRYISAKENPEEIGALHPEWIEVIENKENIYEEEGKESDPREVEISIFNEIEIKDEIDGKGGMYEIEMPEQQEAENDRNGIVLNKTEIEMKTNEVCKLEAKLESGLTGKIEYEIDNKEVIEIYGEGIIVGKKPGEATITVKIGDKTATCKIIVQERKIAVSKIELDKREIELEVGEKGKLEVNVEPKIANSEVTYTVGNKEIAEVEKDGTVIGKVEGTTSVIATAGKRSAVCVIKVKEKIVEVGKIELDKREIEVEEGKKTSIAVTISPKEATNKEIEISTDSDNIKIEDKYVIVDENGKAEIFITGRKAGDSAITVKARDKETNCTVKVKEAKINNIQLDNIEITMQENQLRRLTAIIEPQEATGREITWETSNEEVAKVDSNGLVAGIKEGEATITARVGDKEASCIVKVEKAKQAVLGLSLSTNSVEVKEDDTVKIIASIAPKEASNRELYIKIDNENAKIEGESATVDEEGRAEIEIKGIKEGDALLTVTSGAIEKECRITVKSKEIMVSKITLSEKDITIFKNQTVKLKAKIEPENTTEEIKWTSANEKIATVDKEGKVTAKSEGSTEIIVKTKSGKEAKCKVTVKTKATNIRITKISGIYSNDFVTKIQKYRVGQMSAEAGPGGVDTKEIEWTSSNPEKVAVERVIENGTYYIKSGLNEKKVLDVRNGSTANKAAIQVYEKNDTDAQKFEITNVEGEYYTIKSKKSGKYIDVPSASEKAGTKIQQYASNGTDSQKWEFEYLGNGYYHIRSKANGLYLDVTNAKAENKNQIQVWTENKNKAQRFKLEQISKKAPAVETGTYYIKSSINEKKVLDVANGSTNNKAAIQLYEKNDTDAQKFEIVSIGNGYYVIRSKLSGKVLDVPNGSMKLHTKIQQYSYNGSESQIWKIEKDGNYYRFKSKRNGFYLDVPDAKAQNKNQLQVYTGNKNKAQRFKLEQESKTIKHANIEYVTLKAKEKGTSTVTARLANGKESSTKVTVTPRQLDFSYKGNGAVKSQFSSETMKIVENHLYDVNAQNFYSVIKQYGNFANYAKSLGGIFAEYYGKPVKHSYTEKRSTYDFQVAAEYVLGWVYMYGWYRMGRRIR